MRFGKKGSNNWRELPMLPPMKIQYLGNFWSSAFLPPLKHEFQHSPYINAIYMANKVIMRRIRYPYLINDFIFNMVDSDAKAYWKGIALMKKFTYDVILARLSERENKTKSEETSAGDKKRRAFLDLLLDEYENGNITIDGIREEVDTFMFEGHDTTAAAINFAFYHIAKDSRIKENLQREVDEVFRGDLTRDVTTEDLGKLDYVDAFIREILRLYPSVQRVQIQTF